MSVHTLNAVEFINKLEQDRNLLIVDLRTPGEVASECMENCLHIPLQELSDAKLKAGMQKKGKNENTPVYLLCQSGKRASMAVEKLGNNHNYSLVVLEGGLNAIKQRGGKTVVRKRKVIDLERQVRLTAGLLVLAGVILGFTVNTGFFFLAAFIGAGLTFSGATDTCPMAMVLARMPWNTKA